MTKPYIDVDELKKMEAEILHGTMTNEEWFCGLTTEEKAKWFVDKASWIMGMNQDNNSKKMWVEWLKEIHSEV